MNWTGGSLQRTTKANKGVLQQQKAYFAKARIHLQHTSNSPVAPFRPSYLRDNEESDLKGGMLAFGSGSVWHTGHSVKRRDERTQREASPEARRFTTKNDEPAAHEGYGKPISRHASTHPNVQADIHKGRIGDMLCLLT
jgi:hypothetical protein